MSEFKPKVYSVCSHKDPNKEYFVQNYRPNRFRCTCKDYLYRSKTPEGYAKEPPYLCKHCKEIFQRLNNEAH